MILKYLQRIFAPVAIAFLVWFAWESQSELVALVRGALPAYLGIAMALWCLTHLLSPLAAMLIFNSEDRRIDYRTAAGVHAGNLPARYVPGGIWHTVGRLAAFSRLGFGARDLSAFVVLENALALATAGVLGGFTLSLIRGLDTWGWITALGGILGVFIILTLPYLLRSGLLKIKVDLPINRYVLLVAFANIYWMVAAAAFVAYVFAYAGLGAQSSPLEAAAAYLFSWGVGFLAVFAPQGIGVFEVVASDLLRDTGSLKSVAALLAGFRLVILLADALTWLVARIVLGRADAST